jgi:hypothetical protein
VAISTLKAHGLNEFVTFHAGDSVTNLAKRTNKVDFAYLDSYDCGPGPDYSPCKKHQLAELEAIRPLFGKKVSILMDDYVNSECNKTDMSVRRLESLGFKNVVNGYQILYESSSADVLPKSKFGVLCCHDSNYAEYAGRTVYRNKARYCVRYGYDLRVLRSAGMFADPRSHAGGLSWARLNEMLKMVESGLYEWVWCVGTDTMITNMTLPLSRITNLAETPAAQELRLQPCPPFPNSPAPSGIIKWSNPPGHIDFGKKHLLICGERVTPMQADSFLVRGSPEGAAYLRDILAHYDTYKYHPWVENQVMIDLRDKHAAITYMVPMWMMNSVDFSQWYGSRDEYRDGTDCFGNRGQWVKGDFLLHWPGSKLGDRLRWLDIYEPKVIE